MSNEDRVKVQFPKDIAEHELTVLHNDGLYRHLRFKKPGTSVYYVDVITWPGCLTIHGDMGTYTFSRIEDMIRFFAGKGSIDLRYWQEKLQGLGRGETMVWDPASFKQQVMEEYEREVEENPGAPYLHELMEEIQEDVLDVADDEDLAHRALQDFRHKASGFEFVDSWEWECRDYDYRFVWICYVLRHIADLWLARQAAEAQAELVTA
jgi:hypothetical protein